MEQQNIEQHIIKQHKLKGHKSSKLNHQKNIAIIGSGAMGSAMANILADNNYANILIYGIDDRELEDLKHGFNHKYFKNQLLHRFKVTNNLLLAIKTAQYIILAIPSHVVKAVLLSISHELPKGVIIINVSKGFDLETGKPIHQMIEQTLQLNDNVKGLVSLIGPSHAEEIVLRKLTVVNAVSSNENLNRKVITLFNNQYFKVNSETDVMGANVGAMYKNIIAIISGMLDQLKMGVNARAALLTYGLKEMSLFNDLMGGKEQTIYGLNGVGDLIVTATSSLSRNYTYGFFYQTNSQSAKNQTVEGVKACNLVYNLARLHNTNLPLVNILFKILFKNESLNKEIWAAFFNGIK